MTNKKREMTMKKNLSLPKQILLALVLGVIVGFICDQAGIPQLTTNYLKPFGTIFVNLLKFIVVPVVLLSMIEGILSMGDMKKVGSIGWKTVAFFLCTTAVACVIGLVLGNIFNGAGWFPTLELTEGVTWDKATSANFMDTLVSMFPSNMWESFTKANMLQVIVIALFLGGSMLAAGEKAKLCKDFVSSAYSVIEQLMSFIIKLSPIGVFTMIAWVVATQGAEILGSLALVLLCAYIAYAIHAIFVYSFAARAFAGLSPVKFFKGAFSAMIFAFTSTSSAATLASIGTAGVSGAGMIMLAMVLTAMGIPVDMIMIIYGVDRLFDMGRTCLNVTGDISGTLCVSAWERKKAAKAGK